MPHRAQDLLGGDAAIHHPDALRLAVLRLDLLQGRVQRRVVRRLP